MERKLVLVSEEAMALQKEFTKKIKAIHEGEGRSPKAMVDTFGCQQNVADSQHILGMLEEMEKELPADAYARMHERMQRQVRNAREWCDQVNSFFFRMSGVQDEHGRPMM